MASTSAPNSISPSAEPCAPSSSSATASGAHTAARRRSSRARAASTCAACGRPRAASGCSPAGERAVATASSRRQRPPGRCGASTRLLCYRTTHCRWRETTTAGPCPGNRSQRFCSACKGRPAPWRLPRPPRPSTPPPSMPPIRPPNGWSALLRRRSCRSDATTMLEAMRVARPQLGHGVGCGGHPMGRAEEAEAAEAGGCTIAMAVAAQHQRASGACSCKKRARSEALRGWGAALDFEPLCFVQSPRSSSGAAMARPRARKR